MNSPILKFSHPEYEQQCQLEMGYHLMAKAAGIDMMPCSLMEIDGKKHFLTQRYDRVNGEKVHVQTLGAMCSSAGCYEDIMEICDELSLPYKEKEQMFRRMTFNVYAGCTDDHNRNFSFLMHKDGKWHITPAYDLTFTVSIENGYIEGEEHELSIRGKYVDINEDDLLLFAKENDIKNAKSIISDVKIAVGDVTKYLIQAGMNQEKAKAIGLYLNSGMKRNQYLSDNEGSITDITIYNDFRSIRCKIKGVQQMGKSLSLVEQNKAKNLLEQGDSCGINNLKKELAEKYFKNELNESVDMKQSNGFKR